MKEVVEVFDGVSDGSSSGFQHPEASNAASPSTERYDLPSTQAGTGRTC